MAAGSELRGSAKRVQEALAAQGFDFVVKTFPESTRTAAEAAAAVGCEIGQIAKSLVFKAGQTERPVLVIASGANRVDEKKLADLLGEPIARADAEFVRDRTGFAIGGVAPVAHKEVPVTFVDRDLLGFDEIWAAAGAPNTVFRLKPQDLETLTRGRVADVRKA